MVRPLVWWEGRSHHGGVHHVPKSARRVRGSWPHGGLLIWPQGSWVCSTVVPVPDSRVHSIEVLVRLVHVARRHFRALRKVWGPGRGPTVPGRNKSWLEMSGGIHVSILTGAAHLPELQGSRRWSHVGEVPQRPTHGLLIWDASPGSSLVVNSSWRLHC